MYNQYVMYRILFGLSLLPFIVGCVPVPIASEYPSGLIGQSTLDSLIGESKGEILGLLGRPDAVYASESLSYFIYGARGGEYQVALMVWFPVFAQYSRAGRLYCVLLEFDEENIFRHYRINDYSSLWSDKNCALSFFTPEEIESFTSIDTEVEAFVKELSQERRKWSEERKLARKKVLQEEASRGEPEAQWELYELKKYDGEHDFTLLCKAAERGEYRAQRELAYLHLNGLYGVREDLVLSVVWYSFAEADAPDPAGFDNIRKQLTPEQLIEAEHLYENWMPGQCEREILGTE
jgi:hypothetical protein